jgi:hypothetical protein
MHKQKQEQKKVLNLQLGQYQEDEVMMNNRVVAVAEN